MSKKRKNVEEELLNKVSNLEKNVNALNDKIGAINDKIGIEKDVVLDSKLKSIDRQFKISGDDQVFLGLILAFITVFLSIQVGDISNFFKTVHSSSATYSANMLKWGSLGFLIISTILRYYATLVDDSKTNVIFPKTCLTTSYSSLSFRFGSLEFLIIGVEFIVVVLILNLSSLYPYFWFLNLMWFAIVGIILVFAKVENMTLSFYKSKELIPSDSKPMAQMVFQPLAFLFETFLLFLLIVIDIFTTQPKYYNLSPLVSLYGSAGLNSFIPFRELTVLWVLTTVYLTFRMFSKRKYSTKDSKNPIIDDFSI
jgi:hypothetical protein